MLRRALRSLKAALKRLATELYLLRYCRCGHPLWMHDLAGCSHRWQEWCLVKECPCRCPSGKHP